ncbi:MAG: class I SAM-dependent methyltransferase [Ignavibacteria bacterium]|jgi:2-polyprenyl-3-methyl-5-hydroxy-6-metoxy-1,4-benzoquinol methylase
MICKICSSNSEIFSRAEILNKYSIQYFKCPECGFIQTEEPYWLEEAYSEVINRSDIGLLARNLELSKTTKAILLFLFDKRKKFLDYGAGYGVFVRLMRDFGFDFYWMDKYSGNLFAKDFEAKHSDKFELLTAYEVFEHLVQPVEEVANMLRYSDNILFSTFLIPSNEPKPEEWWYYALDHGQHIALHSRKSLEVLANKFGLNFYTNGKNLHLFSKKKKNDFIFKTLSFPYVSGLLNPFLSKKSLLDNDYKLVVEKLKGKNLS